jgi:hypothetical protein
MSMTSRASHSCVFLIVGSVFLSSCLMTPLGPGLSPGGGGYGRPTAPLNAQEAKLVGTWGGRFAGVVVGVVQYRDDRTCTVYRKNSGRLETEHLRWRIEGNTLHTVFKGAPSHRTAPYAIQSFSPSKIDLRANGGVMIGYEKITLHKQSSDPRMNPRVAMEASAEKAGFNKPVDFAKWGEAAREASDAWGRVFPGTPRGQQPQRSHQPERRCHTCGTDIGNYSTGGGLCQSCLGAAQFHSN